MTHTLHVRSRDDLIFGKGADKKKDPEPTPAIKEAMDALNESSTVDDYKTVGNLCYGYGMFTAAARYYTKTIEMDPDNHVHFSNRSAAYVNSPMLSGPSLAYRDASRCIEIAPQWFKGYLRQADALFAQNKLEEALVAYDKCLQLNPDCTVAINSRSECLKLMLSDGKKKAGSDYEEGGGGRAPAEGEEERTAFFNCRSDEGGSSSAAEGLGLGGGRRGGGEEEAPPRPNAGHPSEERTNELIKTWSRDTTLCDSRTATRKYNATVAEADREAGRTAKEAFMNRFKKKLDSDKEFESNVRASLEKEKLEGDGFDWKRGPANNPQQCQKKYAHGTDEVGAAISAESYKSYKYQSNYW